ncbi:Transcriptional regulator ATRX -like protein [Halotydeus destructor]|nr:Transcriptional regulator ATRX -like protein [Halotydeus destructor]
MSESQLDGELCRDVQGLGSVPGTREHTKSMAKQDKLKKLGTIGETRVHLFNVTDNIISTAGSSSEKAQSLIKKSEEKMFFKLLDEKNVHVIDTRPKRKAATVKFHFSDSDSDVEIPPSKVVKNIKLRRPSDFDDVAEENNMEQQRQADANDIRKYFRQDDHLKTETNDFVNSKRKKPNGNDSDSLLNPYENKLKHLRFLGDPKIHVPNISDEIVSVAGQNAGAAMKMLKMEEEKLFTSLLKDKTVHVVESKKRSKKPKRDSSDSSESSTSSSSESDEDLGEIGLERVLRHAKTSALVDSDVEQKNPGLDVAASSSDEPSDSDVEVSPRKRTGKKKAILSDSGSDYEGSDSVSEEEESVDEVQSSGGSDLDLSSDEAEALKGDKNAKKKKKKDREKRSKSKSGKSSKKGRIDSTEIVLSSDDERKDFGSNAKKHTRKMLSDDQLEQATIDANKSERERLARLSQRQEILSQIQDKFSPKKLNQSVKKDVVAETVELSSEEEEVSTEAPRVILDVDYETKEPIVELHATLAKVLKPHQIDGVKFMYSSTIESVKELEGEGTGCILAHSMGLGKTLQVISFIHTLMTCEKTKKHIRTAIIVVPVNVTKNWQSEFNNWLFQRNLSDFLVWELSAEGSNKEKDKALRQWNKRGGVMIIGHNAFSKLVSTIDNAKVKNVDRALYTKALVEPGADLVIVDEGHNIKNPQSQLNRTLSIVKTKRRIILTGTPLQNNLEEYYTMVNFVKPNLLGTLKEFRNRFGNPIRNGENKDSTDAQVRLMKRRAHVLWRKLGSCIQRLDYTVLKPYLEPKFEYVLKVQLSEAQIQLYQQYLDQFAKKLIKGGLLADANILKLICAHPTILYTYADRQQERNFISERDAEFTDDDEGEAGDARVNPALLADRTWFKDIVPDDDEIDLTLGAKFQLLFEIMEQCELLGEKLLVFTTSLDTIALLEQILKSIDANNNRARLFGKEHPGKESGLRCTWEPDKDYFKITGSKSGENRRKSIDAFNNPNNKRARLFVLSTKAGSLGINLVGANRSIIFDASWNPSFDVQAIFRTYRFGQVKPVYIYRFIASGTMEERIYDRQIIKESLAKRVVDEKQIERHFSRNDIEELYNFEPRKEKETPIPPKDTLLGDLLLSEKTKHLIHNYHEHDSLLESRPEEELDSAERDQAWAEYEGDRNREVQEKIRQEELRKQMEENKRLLAERAKMLQEQMAAHNQQMINEVLASKTPGNLAAIQQMSNQQQKYVSQLMQNQEVVNAAAQLARLPVEAQNISLQSLDALVATAIRALLQTQAFVQIANQSQASLPTANRTPRPAPSQPTLGRPKTIRPGPKPKETAVRGPPEGATTAQASGPVLQPPPAHQSSTAKSSLNK